MTNQTDRSILIIDGFNVFLKFFFIVQETNAASQPVGGAVGFLKFIDRMTTDFCPSKIVVVWENGGPSSRRKKISSTYKANRTKLKELKKIQNGQESMRDVLALDDENRILQLTILTNILKNTPVCQIFIPDTECDDIIGYLAKYKFRNINSKKIIVSNDKDFYQLLDNPMIEIYDHSKKTIITSKQVLEKFSISPRNYCLAKAVVGDVSDNVEGVPGIGFKTLSKRFPSLANETEDVDIDSILNQARELAEALKTKSLKFLSEMIDSEKLIRRNWDLMYLDSSTLSASQISKIDYIIDNHQPKMDKLGLIKLIIECGINAAFDYDRFCSQMRNFIH